MILVLNSINCNEYFAGNRYQNESILFGEIMI